MATAKDKTKSDNKPPIVRPAIFPPPQSKTQEEREDRIRDRELVKLELENKKLREESSAEIDSIRRTFETQTSK